MASRNLSLFFCALLHGLNHALQLILPPLYLAIRDDLGLEGLSPVMLFSTIYFVVYAAMSLPYGILSDRFSKKKILVLGAFLNSVAFILAATTRSYGVFLAAMIIAGLGGGTYHPVANALISNIFRGALGRAFGLIGVGASAGLFAGPVASGFIGEHFGWRMSCLAFAVFGCFVAVAFSVVMPEEETVCSQRQDSGIPIKSFITALMPVIFVFGMRDFCLWGTAYFTPAVTQMNLGFSKKAAGTLIGLMTLTGALSQPLAGVVSDRIGRRRVIFTALVIGGLTVMFFPYFNKTMIFGAAFLSGFMLLCTVPVIDAAAAEVIPPSVRGRLFGVLMTFGIMIGALSPYLTGLIYDMLGGYRTAYFALGLSGLAGGVMVFKIPAKRPHA